MKRFVMMSIICLLAAAFVSAQSPARLSEMRTSRGVDPKLQSPIDITETFGTEAKPIYLTVKLSDAPSGTQVKIVAYYLQDAKPQQIALQDFPDIYGTGYLSFRINPPATGWFVGRYKAVFYLNGQEHGSIGFAVVGEKASTLPPAYKTFTSREHGFSVQYPADWLEGEKGAPSVVCMYLANADNKPVSSLNVQVVPITGADDSKAQEAVNLVAEQLIKQITGDLKGKIRGDTWTTVGTFSGREIDSEYVYEGAKLRQRQLLIYHANNVYVLVLTSDQSVYASNSPHYLNAARSLKFLSK